ncbi:MAG TPA: hypothetical protein VJT08_21835 [Terriglobales bacterium]|nr:hypothetical protein [Terriglobales bacterium]
MDDSLIGSESTPELEPLQELVPLSRRMTRVDQRVARFRYSRQFFGLSEQELNPVEDVAVVCEYAILHIHKSGGFKTRRLFSN